MPRPAPSNATSVVSNRSSRRSRRRRRAGKTVLCGWRTNSLHASCLLTSLLLAVGHFDTLQRDAGSVVVPFYRWMPVWARVGTMEVAEWSLPISLMGFSAQIMAEKYSTARFTFHSLLALLSWLGLALLHSMASWIGRELLLMARCALSAFLFITYTTLVALPKKRKHKRRPNTIYSAFSIASTAPSQASSLISNDDGVSSVGNESDVDDMASTLMDTGDYDLQNSDSRSVFSDDASTLAGNTFPRPFGSYRPGQLVASKEAERRPFVPRTYYASNYPSPMDICNLNVDDDDVLSQCSTIRSLASTKSAPSTASTYWREPRGEWREKTPLKSNPAPSLMAAIEKERTPVRSLRRNIQFLSLNADDDGGGLRRGGTQALAEGGAGMCSLDLPSLSGTEKTLTTSTPDDEYWPDRRLTRSQYHGKKGNR